MPTANQRSRTLSIHTMVCTASPVGRGTDVRGGTEQPQQLNPTSHVDTIVPTSLTVCHINEKRVAHFGTRLYYCYDISRNNLHSGTGRQFVGICPNNEH
mmetsp:Transcript_4434/g.9945  ORF Transcript_4434/g.9945 Transcript_4434/m.9945 type:complete len:99 (+) Transcript_4434:84-380(+)